MRSALRQDLGRDHLQVLASPDLSGRRGASAGLRWVRAGSETKTWSFLRCGSRSLVGPRLLRKPSTFSRYRFCSFALRCVVLTAVARRVGANVGRALDGLNRMIHEHILLLCDKMRGRARYYIMLFTEYIPTAHGSTWNETARGVWRKSLSRASMRSNVVLSTDSRRSV